MLPQFRCLMSGADDDSPHTARGIPLSKRAVGSVLPLVRELPLVPWTGRREGEGERVAENIYFEQVGGSSSWNFT